MTSWTLTFVTFIFVIKTSHCSALELHDQDCTDTNTFTCCCEIYPFSSSERFYINQKNASHKKRILSPRVHFPRCKYNSLLFFFSTYFKRWIFPKFALSRKCVSPDKIIIAFFLHFSRTHVLHIDHISEGMSRGEVASLNRIGNPDPTWLLGLLC